MNETRLRTRFGCKQGFRTLTFRFAVRGSLERRDEAGRRERIRLEPSYRNRSGTLIEFAVAQLMAEDAALGEWRTANHLRTVVRGGSVVGVLCATRDPARLAGAVPEALLGPFAFALDLVEYLISRGEREQARLLIERVTALEPRQRESFEEGRALARQGSMSRPAWHTRPRHDRARGPRHQQADRGTERLVNQGDS